MTEKTLCSMGLQLRYLSVLLVTAVASGCAGTNSFVHDDDCGECGEVVIGSSTEMVDELQPLPDEPIIQQASNQVVSPVPEQYETLQPQMAPPATGGPMNYSENAGGSNMALSNAPDPWAPRLVMLPPGIPQNPALLCEAHLRAAQEKSDAKLAAIEAQLETQKALNDSMRETLKLLNNKVVNLANDVRHWHDEVDRLSRATEEQHRADMRSLQTLVEMVSDLGDASGAIDGVGE